MNKKYTSLVLVLVVVAIAEITLLAHLRGKIAEYQELAEATKDEKLCSVTALKGYDDMLYKGIITSTNVTTSYQSKITEIIAKPNKTLQNLGYYAKLSLELEKGKKVDFYFTEAEMENVKTYVLEMGQEKPLVFESLKPGDTVAMKIVRELDKTKAINITGVAIVKVK
jgi:hypothetical protein